MEVERGVGIDDPRDIVCPLPVIEGARGNQGRYALYHTLVYCVRMLGKEEWEELGTNVENRDEDPVEEHDSDANVSGSPELDEKQ